MIIIIETKVQNWKWDFKFLLSEGKNIREILKALKHDIKNWMGKTQYFIK